LVILISCVCLFTVGVAGSNSGYKLQAENAIDTPERNITFEGTELTIDHIGVFENNGEIRAATSGPTDSHAVELRSATDPGRIIDIRRDGPNRTVSFDIADNRLDPGTYVLLLSDTIFQRAVPVVVSGYDISTDLTEDETTEELTVSTAVTPTASSGQPHAVEAVLWNADTQKRVTLTQQSGDQYQTTVSVSEFDSSYEVYVSAIGDETLYNSDSESEILGLDQASFDDNTESTDDGSSDQLPGGEGTDDTTTDGSTTESTDNSTVEGNETDPVDSSTVDGNGNDSLTDEGSDSVIQPNNDSMEDNSPTDDTGSDGQTADNTPLSPSVAVVALLSSALIAARRYQ
jgi:hypothetical protein